MSLKTAFNLVIIHLLFRIMILIHILQRLENSLYGEISLMFDNWINSDLIYINDILNENGEISQNLILDKLIIGYLNLSA